MHKCEASPPRPSSCVVSRLPELLGLVPHTLGAYRQDAGRAYLPLSFDAACVKVPRYMRGLKPLWRR